MVVFSDRGITKLKMSNKILKFNFGFDFNISYTCRVLVSAVLAALSISL